MHLQGFLALPVKRKQRLNRPKGYWAQVENQRKFLVKLASQLGFDPNQAEQWGKVSRAQIMEMKVTAGGSAVVPKLTGSSPCKGKRPPESFSRVLEASTAHGIP